MKTLVKFILFMGLYGVALADSQVSQNVAPATTPLSQSTIATAPKTNGVVIDKILITNQSNSIIRVSEAQGTDETIAPSEMKMVTLQRSDGKFTIGKINIEKVNSAMQPAGAPIEAYDYNNTAASKFANTLEFKPYFSKVNNNSNDYVEARVRCTLQGSTTPTSTDLKNKPNPIHCVDSKAIKVTVF